jgi:hypothetical protein
VKAREIIEPAVAVGEDEHVGIAVVFPPGPDNICPNVILPAFRTRYAR